MKKRIVSVALDNGMIRKSCIVTDTPGLVVAKHDKMFTVVHEASGHFLLCKFYNLAAALQFADDLRGLANWTQPAEELVPVHSIPGIDEALDRANKLDLDMKKQKWTQPI